MNQDNPEEVERRLEQDRAEIDRTLDALQHRLSPGQLLDQAMGYIRSGGGEMGSNLATSVKQNPLPLILTGVGLAWLMTSTALSHNGHPHAQAGKHHAGQNDAAERARAAAAGVSRKAGEAEEAFQARVTEAKAKALSMKQEANETAEAFKQRLEDSLHRAEHAASDLKHRAQDAWDSGTHALAGQARSMRADAHDAQVRVKEWYSSEPLLAGAIGIAAGTLIAGLVPATRQENRLLGSYGDSVRDQAANVASSAAEHGKAAAAEGARTAAQAAEDTAREATGSNKPEAGGKSDPDADPVPGPERLPR